MYIYILSYVRCILYVYTMCLCLCLSCVCLRTFIYMCIHMHVLMCLCVYPYTCCSGCKIEIQSQGRIQQVDPSALVFSASMVSSLSCRLQNPRLGGSEFPAEQRTFDLQSGAIPGRAPGRTGERRGAWDPSAREGCQSQRRTMPLAQVAS